MDFHGKGTSSLIKYLVFDINQCFYMINSFKHIVNSTWYNVFMRIMFKTVSDHICPPNLIFVSSLLCVCLQACTSHSKPCGVMSL